MGDENIFDELEAFLDEAAPPPVPNQNESSSVTTPMANTTTPGQTPNMNEYSPSGHGGGFGASGGSVSTTMMNNGYPSSGVSRTTKAVLGERLGERLRNQLGGRGENSSNGDLKRKMPDELGGTNDGTFNKAPKLEIKDEPLQQQGNGMFMKSDIKEETSGSQLEAILGLNPSASHKPELGMSNGATMDVKQEYSQPPNKPPPTQGTGILAQALAGPPRVRTNTPNTNMSTCQGYPGRLGMGGNPTSFGGGRDVNSMRNQTDPQSLKALHKLQEVSKDPTLDPSKKQKRALEIINETPKVRQVLEWIQGKNGKGNQQRTMGNLGSNDVLGPLQSSGYPQNGGGMGNCDPQMKASTLLPNSDPSMNGSGGNIATGHEFSPVPPCGNQPGSPMNLNDSGVIMGQEMQKHRMHQWEMNQQQVGGVNQRPQHPSPNVMIGPQGGGVPTTQFVHGSGMGARGMGPSNGVNGYGVPTGMNNNPHMYNQAPNMIVGNNPGQNWSLMRQQPGMSKPSGIPPPTYPYRTPVNVRMERGNIRGISPTIGGYLTHSPGQSNAFNGNCAPSGPQMRGGFPVGSPIGDQYPVRNPSFPNTMYGGSSSNQNMENGMPQMSVRMNVGFSNNPHVDGMSYQNGGQVGQNLGEPHYINPMQVSRNGQTGGGGNLVANQSMGSPMGNPNEFQRGMMHPNNPNLVRPPGHHMSPVAGARTAIPHTSPMVQQHLVSQGNVNGLPQSINPGSPAQRMIQGNGSNNGGVFPANNGLPPPNMTVPDADIQRFGHAAPPNYFNAENVGDGASGTNANSSFHPIHHSGTNQMCQPQQRSQSNQQLGGQVQNSFIAGGSNADGNNGNYSPYNNYKSNGHGNNIGINDPSLRNSADNSGSTNLQQINNGWKQSATELRKTLRTRLNQALLNQGNPNAQQVAASVEQKAFMQSNTQEDYTRKLAEWLANVFSRGGGEAIENNGSNNIEENPSHQNDDYQQAYVEKEKEMNTTGNSQQNQQMFNLNQAPNIAKIDSPSTTSATTADSTTLKEALSNVSTTNLPSTENNNDDSSCKTEMDLFSSNNIDENINNDPSVDSGLDNTGNSSLCKTNPILADLLPGCSENQSFDSQGTSNFMKQADDEETETLDDSYKKAPNVMIGSIKDTCSSVSTSNPAPTSNSSNYNMPSISTTSNSSSTSLSASCSSSSASITTSSSSQSSPCTDVRTASTSVSSHTASTTSSSKPCDSPSMTFAGNSTKIDENLTASLENSSIPTTTTSSSQAFQSPANFPVPAIESNDTGHKGQHQTLGQAPSVSSAVTITSNNHSLTTVANKGSAMVTPVRRPSGKGINGQQSANQASQITNPGSSTVLPTLSGSINGQLPNANNSAVAGQNNIQPHSVDSGIGSPRSIASSTLYSPKIQGTSPSLNPISETLTSSASPPDKGSS